MACTSERRNVERLAAKLRLAFEPASCMWASDQVDSILILARVAEGIARFQNGFGPIPTVAARNGSGEHVFKWEKPFILFK